MFDWAAKTLLRRLIASTGLVVLVTTSLVGFVASRVAREHLIQELSDALERQSYLIVERIPAGPWDAARLPETDEFADGSARAARARITLIASDGRVVGDSEVEWAELPAVENHGDRPEVLGAKASGIGRSVRHSTTVNEDFLYLALRLDGGAGFLRLAMPLSAVNERLGILRRAMLWASSLCLAAALLIAMLIARSIHRPVAALAEAADRLSRGDFSARADDSTQDEVGRLGGVLNSLSARVAGMLGELSAKNAHLKATLDNMVEAVAVVDSDGRVVALNPVMEKLFGGDAQRDAGRPFIEACRHQGLAELLQTTLSSRRGSFREVTLQDTEERVFEAHANPISDGETTGGAVVVLHEITRLRRLEEVRKEFVANVSHELRTPLASIKGFAETLRRGGIDDAENRMGFVDTIEEHADRLTRLVDDLLGLAAIESGKRDLRLESIELAGLAAELTAALKPVADKAGAALKNEVAPGMRVSADRDGLRRILQNLIENAVKYNRPGGTVTVSAARIGDRMEIAVADTGIGVPAQDLPRLFERFYRVDKARSRERGGTGLGLSIVKHLADAHGGSVRAESSEGIGSTFVVSLPAAV